MKRVEAPGRRATAVHGAAIPLAGLTLGLALGLALAGCSNPKDTGPKVVEATPIASYDGSRAQVQRISFCDRIPADAVSAAVGKTSGTRHYGSGERAPDTGDIAHEYGCIFDGATSLIAKAWVFAPPVTPADAAQLARDAGKARGCSTLDPYDFGSPSAGTLCRTPKSTTATYRGLFGDAWLTCTLTAPTAAKLTAEVVVDRAGKWCVQVATTAAS
jgi:hypothetical protein